MMDFHSRLPAGDRRHYVDEADVEVVLSRLPADVTTRIRAIHFTDEARGNRRLGYTSTRGRREIALCALPPHVSLNPFLAGPQTALMFGAVKGAQWPSLAVRRFMLYDVLLHEIGHLQVVHENAKRPRRKFAGEVVAQDFANQWREDLWSKPFDHADPVHNSPSAEETASLSRWGEAHAEYKRGHFERALELCPLHSYALTELAQRIVRGSLETRGEDEARRRAVELLGRALLSDPTSFHANLRMGWNCGHLGRYGDARRHISRAERHGPLSTAGLSAIGDAYADWGFLVEAERLFHKALVREPEAPKILRNYARALWDLGAHTPEATSRALALFERALAAGPNDHLSHFYVARALASVPGDAARAIHHAERALALVPSDPDSAELATRLREALRPDEAVHLVRKILPTRTFLRGSDAPS